MQSDEITSIAISTSEGMSYCRYLSGFHHPDRFEPREIYDVQSLDTSQQRREWIAGSSEDWQGALSLESREILKLTNRSLTF